MRIRIELTRIVIFLILAVFLPTVAFADQLIMKNGDVITGTISKIADGKVYVHPSYADEFSVALAEVASLIAEQEFQIELDDGRTVDGRIALGASGQQVLVVDDVEMPIVLASLVQAAQPDPYYERTSHVDINLTKNSGNTDSSNTLIFADTRMRMGVHRHLAELSFRRDSTNGVKTKEQDLFRYDYNWMVAEPWYIGANASFERDPIRDLDYRYVLGALVGRDFIKDANRFLTASVGVGYSSEEIADAKQNGAVATWRMIYEHSFRDGSLTFFHNNSINYQLFGANNTIFKTKTGFRFDIVANIYANLSYRYDYETDPAPGASKDDSTFVVGIGAEF